MEKKLPIFKLTINPDDETGVDYVALVDEPAIEKNWVAFSKSNYRFKSLEPEKRIISGALMVADLPIYRNDNKFGEYYVVFDRPTIEQIVFKFFRNGYVANANAMHDKNQKLDGVYMIESFIIDSQKGINTPLGHDDLPDGSWFGSFKVDNEEVWNEFIKTGKFKGFSVEGLFDQELLTQQPEDEIESVIQQIHNLTDMLNKIAQNK
jgi:hypothetical protein